jgi:uracil-DNA glycosylase
MNSEDFDPTQITTIVDRALQETSTMHMSFLDMQVMEKLHQMLPKYIDQADIQYILAEIREDIYKSFRIPDAQNLHKVISKCIKCKDEIKVHPQQPQWNVVDPDLVIVALNPESVKGYESLLTDGLSQAGFKSNRCCLTYVTRCPAAKVPSICLANCVPYFHTEIHALHPKLILTLGLDTYSSVTGDATSKAKDVMGAIKWFGLYPVLPQYSLGYVTNILKTSTDFIHRFNDIFVTARKHLYGDTSI